MNKEKVEMIHEKEFQKYGIDPNKFQAGQDSKIIPPEWKFEIIKRNVATIQEPKPIHENFNQSEKVVTIGFENVDDRKEYEKKFMPGMFQSINRIIEEKGCNPRDFSRTMTFESVGSGNLLTINY